MTLLGIRPEGDWHNSLEGFNWTRAATSFADRWGPILLHRLRDDAPVAPNGGGRLRDALRFQRRTQIGLLTMIFDDRDVPYFPYVIHGTTGGQTIVPVAARSLHWTEGGNSVFAMSVTRGDTPANDFPTRVWSAMRESTQAAFREAIAAEMRLK